MKFEKLKKILINKYFILSMISIFALILRLISIDKPLGFCYDEMITYILASKKFPMGIIKIILNEEYHMPLYYFYLSFWMKFFGTSDIILRLSSVLWGILTIPALFFLGKIYKSEKLGLVLASVGCLSPIMIFYSQEFRFYSLLIFLSTLSTIFFLKLIDNPNKNFLFIFYFINLAILYIYTMGIIFIGAEVLLLLIHFYKDKKEFFKTFIIFSAITCTFTIPYLLLLNNFIYASNQSFVDPLGWEKLNIFSILFILNDWFTSFSTCYCGHDIVKYYQLFQSPMESIKNIFLYASLFCFMTGFFLGLRQKNKNLNRLLMILITFLFTEFILCVLGHLAPISRYTVIILPILFLICTDGLISIKLKLLRNTLIGIIFITFSYSAIFQSNKIPYIRFDGIKNPADILMKQNPNGDYLIATQRTEIFEKYVKGFNLIDFDSHKIITMDKTKKENLKIFDKNFVLSTNKYNSTSKLIPYFLNQQPTKELQNFVNKQVSYIPKNKRLMFVDGPNYYGKTDYNSISMYTLAYVNGLVNAKDYKSSLFNLLGEKINLDLKNALKNNPSLEKIKTIEEISTNNYIDCNWTITIYKKL